MSELFKLMNQQTVQLKTAETTRVKYEDEGQPYSTQ